MVHIGIYFLSPLKYNGSTITFINDIEHNPTMKQQFGSTELKAFVVEHHHYLYLQE